MVEGEGAGQHRGQRGGREWSTDNVNDLVVFATLKIVHNQDFDFAGEGGSGGGVVGRVVTGRPASQRLAPSLARMLKIIF